jgi:hypothetical protein
MNDQDIRTAVHETGLDIDASFRNELESMLTDELAGSNTTRATVVDFARRPRRWGTPLAAVGFAAAAATVGTLVLINRDGSRSIGPATTPDVTTVQSTTGDTLPPDTTGPVVTTPLTTAPPTTEPTASPTPTAPATTESATAPAPIDVVVGSGTARPLRAEVISTLELAPPIDESESSTRFAMQADGTILAWDPLSKVIQLFGRDGQPLWTLEPDFGSDALLDVKLGPDDTVYAAINGSWSSILVVAVKATGPEAGRMVSSWDTEQQDVEDGFGYYVTLTAEGVVTREGVVQPYVNTDGMPSGATWQVPVDPVTSEYEYIGPSAGLGSVIRGFVTQLPNVWRVEMRGALVGDVDPMSAQGQPDGSVLMSVFLEQEANVEGSVLVRFLPNGDVEQFVNEDLTYVLGSFDGELFAVKINTADDGTPLSYELVRLVPDA